MKKLIAILFTLGLLAGCESFPAGKAYELSPRNVIEIGRVLNDDKSVENVLAYYAPGYAPDLGIRLTGEAPDFGAGKTPPDYIADAFISELHQAGRVDYQSSQTLEIVIKNFAYSTSGSAEGGSFVEIDAYVKTANGGFNVSAKKDYLASWKYLSRRR